MFAANAGSSTWSIFSLSLSTHIPAVLAHPSTTTRASPIKPATSLMLMFYLHPTPFAPSPCWRERRQEAKEKRRTLIILSSGGAAKSPTKNMNRKHAAWNTPRNAPSYFAFRLGELAAFQKASYAVAYVGGCCHPPLADSAPACRRSRNNCASGSMRKITPHGISPRDVGIISKFRPCWGKKFGRAKIAETILAQTLVW